MPRITSIDREFLEAALFGFERKRDDMDQRISALRNQLDGKARASTTANKRSPKRQTMSTAARARISAAQKKRWAAAKSKRSGKQSPSPNPPKRRTMSPAARKRIAAAQRARWAALKTKSDTGLSQ
jgi:hypothetical protein